VVRVSCRSDVSEHQSAVATIISRKQNRRGKVEDVSDIVGKVAQVALTQPTLSSNRILFGIFGITKNAYDAMQI
jgi:hypothetical protein